MKKITFAVVLLVILSMFCGCASFKQSLFNMGLSIERYRSDLDEKTIQVDGKKFYYLEREGKGETIVLIHGFGADKDNWVRFVRYLPEAYHVYAIDMPGFGESPRDGQKIYNIEFMEKGVHAEIKALGLKRFHIVGNSLGGLVSTYYALKHKSDVISLGLFDSAGILPPHQSKLQILLKKGDNPLIVKTEEDFYRLLSFCCYKEPFIPWPGRSVLAKKYMSHYAFTRKIWHDLNLESRKKDLRDKLPELTMPTFILWGENDNLLDVSSVDVYKKYLPNADAVIMKKCGHVPMLERPEEAAEHYSGFLKKIKG